MSKVKGNGEGSIRQRPDGRWEVRITCGLDFVTGQPKRISKYAATQADAIKLLHQLSVLRETSPNIFQAISLGDWPEYCLDFYMKPSLKQSTYISYAGYIRNYLFNLHFAP